MEEILVHHRCILRFARLVALPPLNHTQALKTLREYPHGRAYLVRDDPPFPFVRVVPQHRRSLRIPIQTAQIFIEVDRCNTANVIAAYEP